MASARALLVFLSLTVNSCHAPARPDGEVRPITARDLVRQYRADPGAANIAYTDQHVRVLIAAYTVEGLEVHWRAEYPNPLPPPALVFRFDDPPKLKAPVWIEGTCRGTATGPVLITSCRTAPPPTQSKP